MLNAAAIFLLPAPPMALLLSLLLLIAAAAPIVLGWISLFPAEREPFARPGEPRKTPERDSFAIFLLVNITLSLLLRVPGVDANPLFAKVVRLLPADWANNAMMIAFIWFGFIPGLAAAYCLVRANPIRWQLLAGGVLTLVLWFAEPWLVSAIASAN